MKSSYNSETMEYEVLETPKWQRVLKAIGLAALAVGLVVFYFWLYIGVFKFELPKTAILKKQNEEWQARMELLDSRLDNCETVLSGIEERDDHVYRSIFGMNDVPAFETSMAGDRFKMMSARLASMEKRACVQSKALDEVAMVSKKAGDMVSCIPAVPPILPKTGTYHLSSPFGYRPDPLHGITKFHEGLDLASNPGNPVYATGNGVVEKVDFKFNGYGNEIVIDHGFGYHTRYAHLRTVAVGVGQQVCRGDQIGELGNSGKSTGPHLHYEVLYKGVQVDPRGFMDLDMSVDEYNAMTRTRRELSKSSQPTYSDILKRSRKAK